MLNLIKSTETVLNLSISILSTSVFNLAKLDFIARLEVSTPVAPFKSAFVTQLGKSYLTLMSRSKRPYSLEKH